MHTLNPDPGAGSGTVASTGPALELRNIDAGYGRGKVLHDVSLEVPGGSVVALLGANGAGKTTLLRVATGLLQPSGGQVLLDGTDITSSPSYAKAGRGICLVPEGRGIFRSLTVAENIRLYCGTRAASRADYETVYSAFPILGSRAKQLAGSLSGGQQQMLALSRAYLTNPRVILLDELSMGLAPLVIDEIFESLRTLAATGTSMLLVEQYVSRALAMSDSVVLLAKGSVTYAGPSQGLDEETVVRNYLGHEL
ncbi:ABC transporter ATP-binding protein [Streptomyces sp. NPDC051985]|uniref:ABC transporter ATP-binding protein n=1 Tax=Streptomyces sp. NPDC051985 TaxID=3155807 RepID=UPI00344A7D1E